MRLYEIIQTPLSPTISYDATQHRLKVRMKPDLKLVDQHGRELVVPARQPNLTLRHINRINKLRKKYLEQEAKIGKMRGLMYGGALSVKQTEIAAAQAELDAIQSQIQAAQLEQEQSQHVDELAMRYVKKH